MQSNLLSRSITAALACNQLILFISPSLTTPSLLLIPPPPGCVSVGNILKKIFFPTHWINPDFHLHESTCHLFFLLLEIKYSTLGKLVLEIITVSTSRIIFYFIEKRLPSTKPKSTTGIIWGRIWKKNRFRFYLTSCGNIYVCIYI